jgi:hypothetical protein
MSMETARLFSRGEQPALPNSDQCVCGESHAGLGRFWDESAAVPQEEVTRGSLRAFYNNITISGGPAPVRASIEELLPDILEGTIEPGRVFDQVMQLDQVPDGYRAMNERKAIKVMVKP